MIWRTHEIVFSKLVLLLGGSETRVRSLLSFLSPRPRKVLCSTLVKQTGCRTGKYDGGNLSRDDEG